jgi:chaperonin cofactor prefoldin
MPSEISPINAMNNFPQPLLDYSLQQAKSLLYFFTELQLSTDVSIAIQAFKEKQPNETPKRYRYPAKEQKLPKKESSPLEQARESSPLRRVKAILQILLKAEQEKHKNELTEKDKAYETLEKAYETLKKDYKSLEKDYKSLEETLYEKLNTNTDEESVTPVSPVQESNIESAPQTIQKRSATPATPLEQKTKEGPAEVVFL